MKHSITTWLVILFVLGALASCNKSDRQEPETPTKGETINLRISAEISLNNDEPEGEELKGLNFKLGEKNGKTIPMPKFEDGEEVDVHTFIRYSLYGGYQLGYKLLKWTYDAKENKLMLRQKPGESEFTFRATYPINQADFLNTGSHDYYLAAFLAPGTIYHEGNKTIEFSGKRELKGVDDEDKDIGELNIPYWAGWRPLTVETHKERHSQKGYRYAFANQSLTFKPLGSVIGYKLGNTLKAYNADLSPTGFNVYSNVFGDKVRFQIDAYSFNEMPKALALGASNIPYREPEPMCYTIKNPSTIEHGSTSDKTYYAWVTTVAPPSISQSIPPSKTQVLLRGTSTAPIKDYTKTYFTDYIPTGGPSNGKVVHGKVYSLTARATHRVGLPIEYVTEYNLVGSVGLHLNSLNPLRFTNRKADGGDNSALAHDNDQSGYYGFDACSHYSPHLSVDWNKTLQASRLIDLDGNAIRLDSKYSVPEPGQWLSLLSYDNADYKNWSDIKKLLDRNETYQISSGPHSIMLQSGADYSDAVLGNQQQDDAVYYAIRHKVTNTPLPRWSQMFGVNTRHGGRIAPGRYWPLQDDSFKCAYRITRVGGKTVWTQTPPSKTTHYRIDVVHLGKEETPTQLATISSPGWWDIKKTEGKVLSRIFPACGYTRPYQSPFDLGKRGQYASSNIFRYTIISAGGGGSNTYSAWHNVDLSESRIYPKRKVDIESSSRELPSVRLFKLDPDQP